MPWAAGFCYPSTSKDCYFSMWRIWWLAFIVGLVSATIRWVLLWAMFNSLRPRQNGRHFADDTFNGIFFNENVWISIKFSLKFVPKGPINNIPALVQIIRTAPSLSLNQWWLVCWRIYASLSLNVLNSVTNFLYSWKLLQHGHTQRCIFVCVFVFFCFCFFQF